MSADLTNLEARARVHAALGDSARLAVADLLRLGDASPGEIGAKLGIPTNLVAHHLNVLRDAGVIERSRSNGDKRRTYVRLVPKALAQLDPEPVRRPRRVLFVCFANAARSQLAAAIWENRSRVPVASAGIEPADQIHPRAVTVAKRRGLPIHGKPTAIERVIRPSDLLVIVCDRSHELLTHDLQTADHQPLTSGQERLHWSVPPPTDSAKSFEATFDELAERIGRLAPAMS